jgi:hypothetical protein
MLQFESLVRALRAEASTAEFLITHTPSDRPQGIRYEGVCVIGQVDYGGSKLVERALLFYPVLQCSATS